MAVFLCLLVGCWETGWSAARLAPALVAGWFVAGGGMLFLEAMLSPWGLLPLDTTDGVIVLPRAGGGDVCMLDGKLYRVMGRGTGRVGGGVAWWVLLLGGMN